MATIWIKFCPPCFLIRKHNNLIFYSKLLAYYKAISVYSLPSAHILCRKCSSSFNPISSDKHLNNSNISLKFTPNYVKFKKKVSSGPSLGDFISNSRNKIPPNIDNFDIPYIDRKTLSGKARKVYFETYGCQMNVNDTEIVWSILQKEGFQKTDNIKESDVILVMTCAIREGAEQKIWNRLQYLKYLKKVRREHKTKPSLKIGILGCMAERLKENIVEKEKLVDLVAGPDSYKELPNMLAITESGQRAVNVILSLDETYADVIPVRINKNDVSAFVSIMRGCNNMCTYCIVPFTRGRERSRPLASILDEVRILSDEGIKQVTLLGQNVNSYRDISVSHSTTPRLSKGFSTIYKVKEGGLSFADLLDKVSMINPNMRIRFTSPHPKDFPDEVLYLIRDRPNICKNLHLPAQSGNSKVLEMMGRGYSREAYLELVDHIRSIIPDIAFSSDFITGFCGETEEAHKDTLSLMTLVKYHVAYLFPYSMRERTRAHQQLQDDISWDIKKQRLSDLVAVYREEAEKLNKISIGSHQLVLVEGDSKKSSSDWAGRNDHGIKVIFPKLKIPISKESTELQDIKPNDYVVVNITEANSQVLKGVPLIHCSISEFNN